MSLEGKIPERTTISQSFEHTVIKGLSMNPNITLETVCEVKNGKQTYPILFARSKSFIGTKPTVFLSAGMHGDEPAGVHAIIRFLNNDLDKYTDRFNVVAFPCLNPTGFDTNSHNTEEGLNINDHFGKQSEQSVAQAIEAKIAPLAPSIVLSLDLHEDHSGEQLGCYMYEIIDKTTQHFAHRVLEVLEPTDICRAPEIYGEKNVNGVIEENAVESQANLGGLHGHLKIQGAQRSMVIETPGLWDIEKRIQTHLAMINHGIETISGKIESLSQHLVGYLQLRDPKDLERVQLMQACKLPSPHRQCYEFFKDDRLSETMIAVVPDDMWKKGSQPSESSAEHDLILVRESYFRSNDSIAWMAHELGHCLYFKNLEAKNRGEAAQKLQKDMQTLAFDDIRSPYPYPNNLIEEKAFSSQFRYLCQKGVPRGAVVKMLQSEYTEPTDFEFFNRLLDRVYS